MLCVYHWLVLTKIGIVRFCGDFEEMSWKCSVFINLYADSRGFWAGVSAMLMFKARSSWMVQMAGLSPGSVSKLGFRLCLTGNGRSLPVEEWCVTVGQEYGIHGPCVVEVISGCLPRPFWHSHSINLPGAELHLNILNPLCSLTHSSDWPLF